jgi:hypothetical protein
MYEYKSSSSSVATTSLGKQRSPPLPSSGSNVTGPSPIKDEESDSEPESYWHGTSDNDSDDYSLSSDEYMDGERFEDDCEPLLRRHGRRISSPLRARNRLSRSPPRDRIIPCQRIEGLEENYSRMSDSEGPEASSAGTPSTAITYLEPHEAHSRSNITAVARSRLCTRTPTTSKSLFTQNGGIQKPLSTPMKKGIHLLQTNVKLMANWPAAESWYRSVAARYGTLVEFRMAPGLLSAAFVTFKSHYDAAECVQNCPFAEWGRVVVEGQRVGKDEWRIAGVDKGRLVCRLSCVSRWKTRLQTAEKLKNESKRYPSMGHGVFI